MPRGLGPLPPGGPEIPKARIGHIAPLGPADDPGLRAQLKSGRCQQGSQIVSAAVT
jgi:hypothetical protein